MVAKKGKKEAKAANHIDVRRAEDIPMLNDILKKNKVVMVLVYADYCGHCHTYKDNVWNRLVADPNRKNGMASIHYDQIENTPFATTKLSGYPTILKVGEDGAPMKFKNEQTGEEEFDYPEARNKEKMSEILNYEPENAENTAELNSSAKESRLTYNTNVNSLINSVKNKKGSLNPKKMATPPNHTEDRLNSQNSNTSMNFSDEEPVSKKGTTMGGGSLYRALLETFSPRRQTKKRRSGKKHHTRRA
jgi:hypothetical protein